MMSSTRRHVVIFVLVAVVGLPFAYFFVKPLYFWVLVGLVALNVIVWPILALAHRGNTARFGGPMTFDEIMEEGDPIRMVQLLRYHLGWSPSKIKAELNRLGVRNHGQPWRDQDIEEAVKAVRRVF